jgi:hypothetical protein
MIRENAINTQTECYSFGTGVKCASLIRGKDIIYAWRNVYLKEYTCLRTIK